MNQSRHSLGIDVGATSVKVILISDQGRIVDEESVAHDLISLHPNWAEEDANIWWAGVRRAVKALCGRIINTASMAAVKAAPLDMRPWGIG